MSATHRPPAAEKAFPWVFLACAAASLVPLWSLEYPPMVDLPQHAAQVFIWQHFHDPAYAFEQRYVLNFLSPYLFGYALARAFAQFLPILVAMKMVVSLVIVALPASMLYLCSRSGADRWGSLLGFPLAYGFAFHWGFLNYLVAVPAGVAFVALGLDLALAPSRRRSLALGAFALFLYACHALVFGLASLAFGANVLLARVAWRRKLKALVPLVLPALVIGVWIVWIRQASPMTGVETLWSEPPWRRLADLPSTVLGAGRTEGAWWSGGLVCLALAFLVGRPDWRRGLLLGALAAYFLMPNRLLGTHFVYPRLAVFIPILAVTASRPGRAWVGRRVGRALVVVFVVAWMAFLTSRFALLAGDGRDFDAIVDRVERGASVLGLTFDPGEYEITAGVPVFAHWVAWIEAKKGGRTEFSFADAFPQIVHYRPGAGPWTSYELMVEPDRFVWQRDGRFDYYLVRSESERGAFLFRQATVPIALEVHAGQWWLYRQRPEEGS